jgi:hypothetical protein
MNEVVGLNLPVDFDADWKQLFEAALVEKDLGLVHERLQNAKDAIVYKMEDSFETASSSERLLLLAALNTISGLFEAHKLHKRRIPRSIGHSA